MSVEEKEEAAANDLLDDNVDQDPDTEENALLDTALALGEDDDDEDIVDGDGELSLLDQDEQRDQSALDDPVSIAEGGAPV